MGRWASSGSLKNSAHSRICAADCDVTSSEDDIVPVLLTIDLPAIVDRAAVSMSAKRAHPSTECGRGEEIPPAGGPLPRGVKLSILDRSRTRRGAPDSAALTGTIERAVHAEQLGFHRFWVAEHHAVPGIASGSPPVLLAVLGAAPIGSGWARVV